MTFESIGIDVWGDGSEAGYSKAKLIDIGKLNELLQERERFISFIKTTSLFKDHFMYWIPKFEKLAKSPPRSINLQTIEKVMGINKFDASSVVVALCRLGAYEYESFQGKSIHSRAQITEAGQHAYQMVFKHVLAVSRNPNYAASQEYRAELERLGQKGLLGLLSIEERRYTEQKHRPGDAEKNQARVLGVVRKAYGGGEAFRAKDISPLLRDMTPGKMHAAMDALKEEGILVSTTATIQKGAEQKTVGGRYRLATPA